MRTTAFLITTFMSVLVGCNSGQGGGTGGGDSGQGGGTGGGDSGQGGGTGGGDSGQGGGTGGGGSTVPPVVECFEAKPGCVLPSDATRIQDPDVSEEDQASLARGNASFALDLGRALHSATANVIYSPHSISTALAMTYAGARTATEQAMAATMRFELPQERLHPAFNYVDLQLQKGAENAGSSTGGGFRLHTANAIWSQIGVPFEKPFLNVLSESYGAHVRLADFATAPQEAEELINKWVSDHTEGKIPKLLSDNVTPETKAVLVNAIYFHARWGTAFNENLTQPGTFRRGDGSTVTAQMMSGRQETGYGAGDGWETVRLPYAGHKAAMHVVLPAEGTTDAFEESLDSATLEAIINSTEDTLVDITMPKFSFGTSTSLKQTLTDLGMEVAFGPGADFTGLIADGDFWIHDVIHKAVIEVDESGTEAAGSTGVIGNTTGSGVAPEPAAIVLDRPFFFFIRDPLTQSILFAGRVNDPTAP
ncbi:serpin family protein [Sorangium sp. So ce1099]|uniref:serpin family protein n=1 Tax=Sorangium sp. So ce1099 TaxID=3133331 RepID=UPI003F60C23D